MKEHNGTSICTQQGAMTGLNVADYFPTSNMKYEAVAFTTSDETLSVYETSRCDALASDISALCSVGQKASKPDDHIVPAEFIPKEPLGPAVRHGDS